MADDKKLDAIETRAKLLASTNSVDLAAGQVALAEQAETKSLLGALTDTGSLVNYGVAGALGLLTGSPQLAGALALREVQTAPGQVARSEAGKAAAIGDATGELIDQKQAEEAEWAKTARTLIEQDQMDLLLEMAEGLGVTGKELGSMLGYTGMDVNIDAIKETFIHKKARKLEAKKFADMAEKAETQAGKELFYNKSLWALVSQGHLDALSSEEVDALKTSYAEMAKMMSLPKEMTNEDMLALGVKWANPASLHKAGMIAANPAKTPLDVAEALFGDPTAMSLTIEENRIRDDYAIYYSMAVKKVGAGNVTPEDVVGMMPQEYRGAAQEKFREWGYTSGSDVFEASYQGFFTQFEKMRQDAQALLAISGGADRLAAGATMAGLAGLPDERLREIANWDVEAEASKAAAGHVRGVMAYQERATATSILETNDKIAQAVGTNKNSKVYPKIDKDLTDAAYRILGANKENPPKPFELAEAKLALVISNPDAYHARNYLDKDK